MDESKANTTNANLIACNMDEPKANTTNANLIVNYIPQTMTDGELHSMFITIGPIQSCRVMKDFKTNYSYGFGFVNFKYRDDAEKAIQQLNGLEISNKRLRVSYARASSENIKETNLYITQIPRHFTSDDLRALFEPYGKIIQMNLLLDKHSGTSRGVGFVRFSLKEEAANAIKNLDGQSVCEGWEKLSVRVAEEHGKQKAAYYAGWQAGLQQKVARLSRGGPATRLPLVGPRTAQRGGYRADRGNNFNPRFRKDFVQTTSGVGAVKQERTQQRFDPMSFGRPSINDWLFGNQGRRGNNFNPRFGTDFVHTRGVEAVNRQQTQQHFDPMTFGFSSNNGSGGFKVV